MMKIALSCRSLLLEKSLRKFLTDYLTDEEDADLIVSDYPIKSDKENLRIGQDEGADLSKPFSRSRLMIKIEEKLQAGKTRKAIKSFAVEEESLEEKIEAAALKFAEELTKIVKEHYETKR